MDKWNITTVNKVSYGQIENCIKKRKPYKCNYYRIVGFVDEMLQALNYYVTVLSKVTFPNQTANISTQENFPMLIKLPGHQSLVQLNGNILITNINYINVHCINVN